MLVPILNVTFWNGVENVHDRYLYLPSVAICMMLASGLSRLKQTHFMGGVVATSAIAVAYACVTLLELPYWQNDYVLAQRGISVSPGHPIAPQLAGNVLIREQRMNEAIPYLVDALNAQSDNVDTLCSLSFCYSEINALPLAEESVSKAIALHPTEPRAHLLLGMVRFKQRRLSEAEAEIRRGIELQRVSTGVLMFHYYLGNVLYEKGDVQGAIREYRLETRNDSAIDPAALTALARIEQIENHDHFQVR
jgi:Flp pilus assembly protein TadD